MERDMFVDTEPTPTFSGFHGLHYPKVTGIPNRTNVVPGVERLHCPTRECSSRSLFSSVEVSAFVSDPVVVVPRQITDIRKS